MIATSDHLPVICEFRWGQTAPTFNAEIAVDAISSNFVRPSGPVGGAGGTNDLEVEGSSNGTFASFGVIDFDLGDVLDGPGKVAMVDNIALNLVQDNEFFTDGGPFSIYVADAAAVSVPIDGSISYQVGQNGINSVPAILSSGAVKVATFAGVHEADGSLLPDGTCLLYTSPSPRDQRGSRMPSSA